jgi:hypothetical protein
MPEAQKYRSEGILNRHRKCLSLPNNPRKILNRGNELKDLLKPKGLAFFRQQNELVFERQKQRFELKSRFLRDGQPSSRRQGSGIGETVTSDERNSERVLNRRLKWRRPPRNPEKILNRGNELKDLLKPKGLEFFRQQNELLFEHQKQCLKPKITVPRALRAKFQASSLGYRGSSDERRAQPQTPNGESRTQNFLAALHHGGWAGGSLTTIKNEGTNRECL